MLTEAWLANLTDLVIRNGSFKRMKYFFLKLTRLNSISIHVLSCYLTSTLVINFYKKNNYFPKQIKQQQKCNYRLHFIDNFIKKLINKTQVVN